MPNFQAPLNFLALDENKPPQQTNLLFYNQPENQLSRGWYDQVGKLMLVGSQFTPTHFAEYEAVVEKQSGRVRDFSVKNESNFDHVAEVQATSHHQAATLYRQQQGITGYAKLITTDMEALFGQRDGDIKVTHDSSSFIQPTIFYRNSYHGGDGWQYGTMRITIAANCPKCGQRRGAFTSNRVVEDGEYFYPNAWHNECGHQDSYKDAYLEYKQLMAEGLLDAQGLPVQGEVLETPAQA